MQSSGQQAEAAIAVSGLQKSFRIPHEQVHTLKERAVHPLRRTTFRELHALNDVSFDVKQGEFFGVVGRNGSGKSTLMKCLAGIYRADDGEIWARGRMATFIELGVGFNPDLAARDNVVMNGIMLGLSPREARKRVETVIDFAELAHFTDLKLKNYSSGMLVRLAFAVMIQVDADILLIDEVLAVGDAAFQQKCFDEFFRMRDEGKTVVFVTHDMAAVERFCHRALLLERGRLVATGDPDEIAEQYLAMNFARDDVTHTLVDSGPPTERATAVIREVWFEDEYGQTGEFLPQGRRCIFKARVELRRDVEELGFSLTMDNDNGQRAFAASAPASARASFRAGEIAVLSLDFQNELIPGWRYHVTLDLESGPHRRVVERRERVGSMVVTGARLVLEQQVLEHSIRVEPEQTTMA